jgi:hypothetical protein
LIASGPSLFAANKTRRSLRVSNSRLQIAFGIDVQEFPISVPTSARDRRGGTPTATGTPTEKMAADARMLHAVP